jgi:Family of unknown function (DUF5947)
MQSLLKLRRLVQPPPPKFEKCELCGAPMEAGHRHVVDVEKRRLLCTCRPCYLLFTHRGAAGGKLQSVSERYLKLPLVEIPGDSIPVGMVFFIRDSASNRVRGFYPSPAGATESGLSIEMWDEMVQATPELATLEPEVEALLVSKRESWIVPVDACYELVGRIKRTWRGFDGGSEAWREIDGFFAGLAQLETRCA